ncbi:MAG: helix-turn-helix transcriptional regulator, partial [Chlamydiia bacterium]|nr:helix-turn-helix transcriptional regulator [Chlamydiia bacterium]
RHSDQIRKVTRPLRDHLDVGYFSYHHITWEGKYTVLVDQPVYAEHYIAQKYYEIDPYLRRPEVFREGICPLEMHLPGISLDSVIRAAHELMRVRFGYILIQKSSEGMEFFAFSPKLGSHRIDHIALNHQELLLRFGAHFKSEMAPLLTRQSQEAPVLSSIKGDDYFFPGIVDPNTSPHHIASFLDAIGEQDKVALLNSLSPRERECLALLRQGLTAQESGWRLGLTQRTVESYRENMKNKLDCYTKGELSSLAEEFHKLGLLP